MGDPKRIRKKYKTPRQPFDKNRIHEELLLIGKYGLRNMKDVWKHSTVLGNFRSNARHLLSLEDEDRKVGELELLGRLQRMGLLSKNATLDDVLSLQIQDLLERRLQTIIYKKGLACTPYHARQMIVHKHIMVGDNIVNSPSYLVSPQEEKAIQFSQNSPFVKDSHKALPANVYKSKEKVESKRETKRGKKPEVEPKPTAKASAKKILEEESEDVDVIAIAISEEENEK